MTDIIDLLKAVFKLGLPMVGLSWFLFAQLYNSGDVGRDADRKKIKSHVKSMRAAFKSKERRKVNFVYDKWMWFGSGFYGLAALWTFAVIELTDALSFLVNYPGWSTLMQQGIVSLLVDILVNQFANVVSAFVWFSYWDVNSILMLVLVAYAGYWVGVELARRETGLPVAGWLEKLRALLKPQDH